MVFMLISNVKELINFLFLLESTRSHKKSSFVIANGLAYSIIPHLGRADMLLENEGQSCRTSCAKCNVLEKEKSL